jgi:hypothetical protein
LKTRIRENQVPSRLWDYGIVYISEIQSLIARGVDQRPGIERFIGQTVDISEWLDFNFYDRVWYWDHQKTDMNTEQAKIGRRLGSIGYELKLDTLSRGQQCNILQQQT